MPRCAQTGAARRELLIEKSHSGGKEQFSEVVVVIAAGRPLGPVPLDRCFLAAHYLRTTVQGSRADADGDLGEIGRQPPPFTVPRA